MMTDRGIVLASTSPRRRELVRLLVGDIEAIGTNVDESFDPDLSSGLVVERLATQKAIAGLAMRPGRIVLGADTIVVCDGDVLNKPLDRDDAREMLTRLSGRNHEVYTGVAVAGPDAGMLRCSHQRSVVTFRALDDADIERYLATDVWTDKAGGYGIQGLGGDVVESVLGCYQNVVGFPLCLVGRLLRVSGCKVNLDRLPCGFRTSAMCPDWPD